jgi:PAS domain S-box-containing protein
MQNTTAESALDNFLTLLNFIADPAAIIDEKGNFLVINQAFEKISGYRNDEMTGKNSLITNNLTSEDIALIKINREKRSKGIKVAPYEIATNTPDNTQRYLEVNAKKISFFDYQPALLILFRDVTNRKLVEQKLTKKSQRLTAIVNEKVKEIKENADTLRTIFNSSPVAILFIEPNGNLLDYNNVALKLFGYLSREEAKNGNIFSHFPEKEQKKFALALEKITKTGILRSKRFSLMNKNGLEFPVEISLNMVKDANGQIIGFVINAQDISERKSLEDALIASEEKFRTISTASFNAIILADAEDKIVYWNPAAERLFGYKAQEVTGKEVTELIVPPENHVKHRRILEKFAHNEQNIRKIIEVNAIRKDKTMFPAELSATNLKLNCNQYVVGIIHDLSHRKKVEEAIKQERDLLETVTENINAGLAIISNDYRILWANKLMHQVSQGSIQNKLCFTVFNDLETICPDCGVKKIFENGEPVDRHDYYFSNKDGKQRCTELIVTPIKDKNGKIIAALELAVDVTEKRRLESQHSTELEKLVEVRTKQLEETQEKLVKTERLAAIGELAAMVGHDLRNPLTGMKAATYYLKGKIKNNANPKTKEMLELIDNCIDQSNKIVNDLLEYSRTIKLELTETDPSAFIKQAQATIQVPKSVEIIQKASHRVNVKVDSAKMLRVFLNIIKNAFDAMPTGGTLTIESKQTSKNWVVTFTDTGQGMTKETLQKLGNPLFTTKAKGMGFGIPICKRIVEAHGGKLLIDSILGQGTIVTVKIPLYLEQNITNTNF